MQEPDPLDSTNFPLRIGPLQDLFDCPGRVLRDQGFRIQRGFAQRGQIFTGTDISQRHAHVSQKSPTLDPFDWRIPKQVSKLSFIESQIIA